MSTEATPAVNFSPMDILQRSPLFSALPEEQLARIGALARMEAFPAGTTVFRKDEPGDAFYLVAVGQVRVFVTNEEGAEVELARLGPGESFGEMSLLTGEPRSASVSALEPVQALVLPKSDFDRVLEEAPALARHFVALLGRRLRQGNVEVERRSSREQALRELMAEPNKREPAQLVGKSRPAHELVERAEQAAGTDVPLGIVGEPGTEKELVAQWVHEHGARAAQVFLAVDCARIPPLAPHSQDQTGESPLAELSQESALFGHRRGAFAFAKVNRLGYLEVARGGTLFLNNVDRLGRGVQAKLCEYLKTGRFRPLGSLEEVPSPVRLVLGCNDAGWAVEKGQLDPQLWSEVSGQQMAIAPLRDRRRDLPAWVERFVAKHSRIAGKEVRGATSEAMNVIYGYDWPRNTEELEEVVRRGVSLADGPQLEAEQVFVGVGDFQGGGFNLLRIDGLRRLLERSAFPGILQTATVGFMALVLVSAFWGPRHSPDNIAVVLAWALMWPALAISVLFAGRFYCAVCPMGAVASAVQGRWTLGRKVPSLLKKYGLYSAALGFVLIIWVEQVMGMTSFPLATALLVLSILTGSVVASLLFERAAWCRYLCPLGRMVGVYSTLSLVGLRSNGNVCSSGCSTHSCYTGNKQVKGCPFYQGAFSLQSNEFCKLCAACIKSCPNRSPRLYLRIPGQELWHATKYTAELAFMVPFLVATVLAMRLRDTSLYERLLDRVGHEYLAFTLALMVAATAVWALVGLVAALWRRGSASSRGQALAWVAYSLVPLALSGELAHQTDELLRMGGQILPVLGRQIGGLDWTALGWSASPGLVRFWQVVLLLAGGWASVYVGRRILERQGIAPRQGLVRLGRYGLAATLLATYLAIFLAGR